MIRSVSLGWFQILSGRQSRLVIIPPLWRKTFSMEKYQEMSNRLSLVYWPLCIYLPDSSIIHVFVQVIRSGHSWPNYNKMTQPRGQTVLHRVCHPSLSMDTIQKDRWILLREVKPQGLLSIKWTDLKAQFSCHSSSQCPFSCQLVHSSQRLSASKAILLKALFWVQLYCEPETCLNRHCETQP